MTTRRMLMELVEKVPGWLALSIVLGFLSACLSGLSVAMVAPLILELLGQRLQLDSAPMALSQLAKALDSIPAEHRIVDLALLLVAAFGLKSLVSVVSAACFLHLAKICTVDLRKRALETALNADVGYFAKVRPNNIVASILTQVDHTARIIVLGGQLFSTSLTIAVFVFIMLYLSWWLTAVAFVLFLGAFYINHVIIHRQKYLSKESLKDTTKLSASLYQIFTGIRLVKASATETMEQQRVLALSNKCLSNVFHVGIGSSAIGPVTEFTGMVAIVVIVVTARFAVGADALGASAVLLTFLVLLFRMLAQVNSFNSKRCELVAVWPSAETLRTFLQQEDKILLKNGTKAYAKLSHGITFADVSFSYDDAGEVLQGLSFFIPKGTSLALVGRSGAGKTTVADLLTRCYDPAGGTITLDGADLKEFDVKSLRSNIAVVSQDPFLFNETIRFNIEYGCTSPTEKGVLEAASRAHALPFIEKLPLGLDSPVGERGALLSAGEKQRIAIARAIMRDPDILILDEATSALDSVVESMVQSALEDLMRDRTTLIIAHRLSTVRNAGQIGVLQQGRIVEIGSHDSLIEQKGLYRSMCEAGSVLIES